MHQNEHIALSGNIQNGKTTLAMEVASYFKERKRFSQGIYSIDMSDYKESFKPTICSIQKLE